MQSWWNIDKYLQIGEKPESKLILISKACPHHLQVLI